MFSFGFWGPALGLGPCECIYYGRGWIAWGSGSIDAVRIVKVGGVD